MRNKSLFGIPLLCVILTSIVLPAFAADTLLAADFKEESWAKTVDYFDYARAYATLHAIPTPAGFQNYHANMYMTYINTEGLHLLYAGLENVTFGGPAYFRIPMQSFIMHYKTNNRTRDVILASTFLMLLAFNETGNSIHADSPDMNDTLWASFSMGFDLSVLNATLPVLNSRTETLPLTHSDDKLHWSWGMRYTNLTALWWRTWVDPVNPHFDNSWPVAITVYDELTFTYNLTIDPTAHTATLTENHVIGRMRDLLFGWIPLLWVHYNSTGTYWLGSKIGNDTIYDFVQDNEIKMSIVNFQTSILADRETYSTTPNGQNVTDTDTPISDTSIATYADDGEKICEANFGTKKTYKLYNYTDDPTETNYATYNATARTAKIAGFAHQAGLFQYHIGLMKFLPLIVVNMYPQLYERAKETITNMSRANYFYLIAYPTYSGYRVEHDPTLTVYLTESASAPLIPPNLGGLVIIGGIAAAVIVAVALVVRRRKPRQTETLQPPAPTTKTEPSTS
jgi:hypothetical protein